MGHYQVILAYDGTDFYGFQRQAGNRRKRTVQGVFEEALRALGWQGSSILAAGRTDTGAHALGQVVVFDLAWKHSRQALQAALNAHLPEDVAVSAVRLTRTNFHPRHDALARRYQYRVYCQPTRNPLRERYAWRVWPILDLARLQQAASQLIGTHDFAAFGTPPRPESTTIRTVFEAGWEREGSNFVFTILADAFLYRMVRRLVHFQVSIGKGEREVEDVSICLREHSKTMVRGLAPAKGLTLMEVVYSEQLLNTENVVQKSQTTRFAEVLD